MQKLDPERIWDMLFVSVKSDRINSISLYTPGDFFVNDISVHLSGMTQSAFEHRIKYKMKDRLVFQSGEET